VVSTRQLVVAVVLTLFLAGAVLAATKWALDMSFPGTETVKTQKSFPQIGNLALIAVPATENEVILNATFRGKEYITQPRFVWTIWISDSIVGFETILPRGLNLVEGTLRANGSCPLPNSSLSLQAKLRAVADGEWVVYGRFSATRGPGEYYGLSTGGIKITVSNGSIVRVEEAHPTDTQMTTQQLNNQTEQPTRPPIHPTNP